MPVAATPTACHPTPPPAPPPPPPSTCGRPHPFPTATRLRRPPHLDCSADVGRSAALDGIRPFWMPTLALHIYAHRTRTGVWTYSRCCAHTCHRLLPPPYTSFTACAPCRLRAYRQHTSAQRCRSLCCYRAAHTAQHAAARRTPRARLRLLRVLVMLPAFNRPSLDVTCLHPYVCGTCCRPAHARAAFCGSPVGRCEHAYFALPARYAFTCLARRAFVRIRAYITYAALRATTATTTVPHHRTRHAGSSAQHTTLVVLVTDGPTG